MAWVCSQFELRFEGIMGSLHADCWKIMLFDYSSHFFLLLVYISDLALIQFSHINRKYINTSVSKTYMALCVIFLQRQIFRVKNLIVSSGQFILERQLRPFLNGNLYGLIYFSTSFYLWFNSNWRWLRWRCT